MSRKQGKQFKGKSRVSTSVSTRAQGGLAWAQAREGAQGLWEVLCLTRGPGKGVGVTARVDPNDPEDTAEKAMLRARAVDILLADHPELTVSLWQQDLFVSFRADLAVLEKSESWQNTAAALTTAKGEDLVVRTMGHRARKDEILDTYPRWPGALSGKAAHEATEADWAEWRVGLAAYREREAERTGTPAPTDIIEGTS